MGMIVDAVDEVLTVPASAIEPVDEMVVSVDAQFLSGIVRLEDRLIIMLDQEQVLSAGEARQLERMKVPGKVLKQVEAQTEEADMLPSGR
jgi:purine-binding chemotaxis protein CheW